MIKLWCWPCYQSQLQNCAVPVQPAPCFLFSRLHCPPCETCSLKVCASPQDCNLLMSFCFYALLYDIIDSHGVWIAVVFLVYPFLLHQHLCFCFQLFVLHPPRDVIVSIWLVEFDRVHTSRTAVMAFRIQYCLRLRRRPHVSSLRIFKKAHTKMARHSLQIGEEMLLITKNLTKILTASSRLSWLSWLSCLSCLSLLAFTTQNSSNHRPGRPSTHPATCTAHSRMVRSSTCDRLRLRGFVWTVFQRSKVMRLVMFGERWWWSVKDGDGWWWWMVANDGFMRNFSHTFQAVYDGE